MSGCFVPVLFAGVFLLGLWKGLSRVSDTNPWFFMKKGLSAFADSPFFCVGRDQSSMRSSLNTTGRAPSLQQVRMVWFTAQEGSPPCTMVNT